MKKSFEDVPLMFVLMVMLGSAVIMFNGFSHSAPIMHSDEYAYVMMGLFRDSIGLLQERDPGIQKISSPLYSLLLNTISKFSGQIYDTGRVLNSMVYLSVISGASYFVYLRAGTWAMVASMLIGMTMPSTAMAGTLMAEMLFYSTAIIGPLVVINAKRLDPVVIMVAGGGLALSFLVKPHALAPAAGVIFVILFRGMIERRKHGLQISRNVLFAASDVVVYMVTAYAVLIAFSVLFTDTPTLNPRYPMGDFYNKISSGLISNFASTFHLFSRTGQYILANGLSVLFVTFPFLFIAFRKAISSFKAYISGANDTLDNQVYLVIWLAIGGGASLFMASSYVAMMEQHYPIEAGRLHARYYAPVYFVTIFSAMMIPAWRNVLHGDKEGVGRGYLGPVSMWAGVLAVGWSVTGLVMIANNMGFKVWFQDNLETFFVVDAFANANYAPEWKAHAVLATYIAGPLLLLVFGKHVRTIVAVIVVCGSLLSLSELMRIYQAHGAHNQERSVVGEFVRHRLAGVPDHEIMIAAKQRFAHEMPKFLLGIKRLWLIDAGPEALAAEQLRARGIKYVFVMEDREITGRISELQVSPYGTLYEVLE